MANTDRCPDCGATYALVRFRHRCVARTGGSVAAERTIAVEQPTAPRVESPELRPGPPEQKSAPAVRQSQNTAEALPKREPAEVGAEPTSTYRYRDAEKRRAYQREYMKAYRARP